MSKISIEVAKQIVGLLGIEYAHQVEVVLDTRLPGGPREMFERVLETASTVEQFRRVAHDACLDSKLAQAARARVNEILLKQIEEAKTVELCRGIWRYSNKDLERKAVEKALTLARSAKDFISIGSVEALQRAQKVLSIELALATTAQECYKLAEDVEWLLRNYPVSVQSITVHFEAKRKAEKLILEQLAITKTFDDCWILFKAIPQNIREYSELTTQIIKKALCYATVRECSYVHLDASNNRGMEKVGRQQAERLTREQLTRATSFQECKVVLDEAWSSPEVVSDVWEKATQYAASLDEWQVCFKAIRKMVGVHVDQIAERRSSCIRAMAAIIAETSETQG